MRYLIRANYYRQDLGRLLLDGLRPSVSRLRQIDPVLQVAFQPHWMGGTHLLVATESTLSADATNTICNDLIGWFAQLSEENEDAQPRNNRLHHIMRRIDGSATYTGQDMTVEHGDFTPRRPRGDETLGQSRDAFRAETLDQSFDLIQTRKISQGDAVVEFGLRLMALSRLRWLGDMNLWAMSIVGHALANDGMFEAPRNALIADRLEAAMLTRLDQTGLMTSGQLESPLADWIGALQHSYDRYVEYLERNPENFTRWGIEDAQGLPPVPNSEAWWARAAMDPRRVVYRLIVNDAYDLQLTIGLPVVARLLVCHVINRIIVRHLPNVRSQILEVTRSYGA